MLQSIFVYDAPDAIGLDIAAVAHHLAELLPDTQIETRTDFFTWHLGQFSLEQVEVLTQEIAARLQEREVHNLVAPERRAELEPVTPEERDLGPVYLAAPLQEVMRAVIPAAERGPARLHLAYITQCIGHWPTGESSLRLQIIEQGEPTIISTTGFVEAPALPREYAFRRAHLLGFGMEEAAEELDALFAAEALRHGDARINQVAVGFALQAVFWHLLGEEGCDVPTCPLHAAATHDELARAHMSEQSGLCDRHMRMLMRVRERPRESAG
ncbi:MAG: DUF6775 family putative metallopeptidase [Armatimonadota bacterium]